MVSSGRKPGASRRSLAWWPGRDDTTAGRETDVLGPHELVQGLGRILSSEAAALHAAEGRADEGTPGVVVDEHHADLEAPGEPGGADLVTRADRGRQPVGRRVREPP